MIKLKQFSNVLLLDKYDLNRRGLRLTLSEQFKIPQYTELRSYPELQDFSEPESLTFAFVSVFDEDQQSIERAVNWLAKNKIPSVLLLSDAALDNIQHFIQLPFNAMITAKGIVDTPRLLESVVKIEKGEQYICPKIVTHIVRNFGSPRDVIQGIRTTLTSREVEIVNLVAKGYTSKRISEELFVSARTVDTHRYKAMKKLKAKNSFEMVQKAKELNLLH